MELVSASGWPGIVTEDFEVIMQAGPVEKVEQIVDQYKNKQGYGPSPDRQVDEEKKDITGETLGDWSDHVKFKWMRDALTPYGFTVEIVE